MTDLNESIKNIKSIDNLKSVIESYGVKFKKDSTGYVAKCPFHSEKTPSFRISEKNNAAFYKCFGCNIQGDIINFIKEKEGFTTLEATKKAYEILGIKLDIQPSKLDKLKEYIEKNIKLDGYYIEDMYPYMLDDNTPSLIKVKFRNKFDKTEKDMRTYKIIDIGDYYKLGTKSKDGDYNYTIYNYPRVKEAINKMNNVYFVEGEKDAETLNKLGFTATTILAKTNDEKVWNKYKMQLQNAKIVFIGDTGKAGKEFKQLVWEHLKDVIQTFKVVDLPGLKEMGDNKDVTDWLEVGHTKEELIEAIKDSWDWKVSTKWKDVTRVTKQNGVVEIKPIKTIDNFKLMLERSKTEVYFNVISREIEAESKTFDAFNLNMLETEIYSYCNKINFKHTAQEIRANLRAIAQKKKVNPFKEYLDSLKDKWDGTSRLEDFYNLFETVEFFNDDLKRDILKRWLLQFLGSAYDPKFKGQGILVLKGKQGMKKTTSMEYLIPIQEPWVFLSEQKFVDSRDGIQTITSNQLVEFSEFARSAKEVDALKGFVTTPFDKYVIKYMPTPESFKRHTVYYATVNDDEFLIDVDNRRFWILDLISMDYKGFKKFDFNQLWAEMYHIYHVEGDKKYWFEEDELEVLEESNQGFKFKGELEGQIELCFDFKSSRRIWMTATEILEILGKPYTPTKITRTLKSMRIEQKMINNKAMPRNKYNAMPLPRWWKGKIHEAYKDRVVNIQIADDPQKNNDIEGLQKDNKAMKELLLKYKEQIIKLEKKNKELEEVLEFYEGQNKLTNI